MKINRKGFTLVELLVTILIVGLIVGLTVFGIITLTKDSEDKVTIISEKNIKEAARIYSSEASSDSWKKNSDYDYDAFCTTIGELMNKGLLDKNASIVGDLTRNNYVIVKRNKITLAVDSEELVSDVIGNEYNQICTGQVSNEGNITKPKIDNYESFTDRIEISFDEGKALESSVKDYKCLYGESSSNVNREGLIEGNKCILDELRHNKQYYVFIYMNTSKGSSVLAEGSREYSTKDFVDTTISQNGNKINIAYKDDTIYRKEGYHYFKSGISGTSSENVLSCDLNNNKFTCNESTNVIEKDKWYKVSNNNITITYPEENNKFNINTKVCDDSNNCKDNNKEITINKFVVKFYRNGALSIDGSTSDYVEKYCITGGNSTCNIVAPSITRQVGYSVVGWNRSSSATSSEWNVGATKNINSNVNYYAISRINKVYIKYNVNDGYIATSSNSSGKWTKDSDGIVLKDGKDLTTVINYGANIKDNGLNNYNNSSYINISKTGYSAVSGAEWKCLSGNCKQSTYSHGSYSDTGYTAASFCDASNGDCTVELGVNWKQNVVNIKYNVNGGSIATSSNSSGTWTKNGSDTVLLDGKDLITVINYGGAIVSTGLANYNNSSYINISKTGYSAVSGAEWKCLSGNCEQTTYSQTTVYSASDFCDASSSDCTVELGVNWTPKEYTINYYLGNGTSTNGVTKIGSSTCYYDSICTLNSWNSFGRSFPLYDNEWRFAGWNTSESGTTRTYTNNDTFKYTTEGNINLYAIGKRTFNFYSGVAPTSAKATEVQYWNPRSTAAGNLTSINVPSGTAISGWKFLGYRATDNANSTVTISSYGDQKPAADSYSNLKFRSKYSRTIKLQYNNNGGKGDVYYSEATQYYNSGIASGGSNSGANISTPTFTLASNNFTRSGYRFSRWAVGSKDSEERYSAGTSNYGFSPGVSDTTIIQNLYAVWVKNVVNIKYNVNDGYIATSSNSSGTWTKDSDGIVRLDGDVLTTTINYGENIKDSGLNNYNNSSYINISRTGYKVIAGAEWRCLSGNCKEETYSQSKVYSASDFCDASNGDCTVVLGVNWTPKEYTINYYLGNGTSTNGVTKIGTSTCDYDSSCTLNSWNSFDKTFPLYDNEWRFAGWNTSESGTTRTYTNNDKFKYTTEGNINLYAIGKRTFNFYSGVAPTSAKATEVQYWNPKSTAAGNLTSINVPSGTAISGWTFLGYRATDNANSTVTISSYGDQKPAANSYTNLEFRSKYERTIQLQYNPNNGSGSTYYSSKEQYYNSGRASDGKNIGASISTPTFTLASNNFTRSGYRFSRWAVGSKNSGERYSAGTSYSGFSPGVNDKTLTLNLYAKWIKSNATITGECSCEKTSGGRVDYSCSQNNLTDFSDCSSYCNQHHYPGSIIESTCGT